MSLLHWFGEQSEAIKLGILTLIGGFSAGFWAAVKEWRKPVLQAPTPVVLTSPSAPRSADEPLLLMLNEIAAVNANLALLISVTKDEKGQQDARIARVLDAIIELTHQIERLRDRMAE